MSGRLVGKRAFITAAAQGIGRATAETFLREGAEVIATDINMEILSELSGNVILEKLDARDDIAIQYAAERHSAVDILFNCAGYVHNGTILESTEEDWDIAFDLNVKSMYRVTKAFLPAMIENGGGSIINTSSVASAVKGIVNRCVYSATKAFVRSFGEGLAAECRGTGVAVTNVHPGGTATEFVDVAGQNMSDFIMSQLMTSQAVARIGLRNAHAGRVSVVTGVLNKLTVFALWLMPDFMVRWGATAFFSRLH